MGDVVRLCTRCWHGTLTDDGRCRVCGEVEPVDPQTYTCEYEAGEIEAALTAAVDEFEAGGPDDEGVA